MRRALSLQIGKIMKIIDIGANLSDPMYEGIYNGTQKHERDLDHVLNRAWSGSMEKIIITVGSAEDYDTAIGIVRKDARLFTTMGCHPTRCGEFETDPEGYYAALCAQIEGNRDKVIAIGECGLDYDRLKFCDKPVQQTYFRKQLQLADQYGLPLFLHCRNAHDDFIAILKENLDRIPRRGVVHTFDGSLEAANQLLELGFFIGINGCSLKTEENLRVAAAIPDDRILVETDSPWCEIRPSHAGARHIRTKFPTVKKKEKWEKDSLIGGRCEPVMIIQVLEVLAGIKGKDVNVLAEEYYRNTLKLFFPKEHGQL